ncbi:NDP-sugar pyrophosphorylase, includes eIF-2Bgamma, eIF-2Bepsilon, and LPS biosynthesis proteins [Thiocapsa roseopersicina]|uniref:NDP-sugar pyrophosphorylase, includes eIF-2Bgamma, eIF-2Bepsilon, and LPS biosynthesis proteins n=2 Tax=Thiocapsa roseopersicina TaxID=1058 RepID=A0A1H2UGI9_THIRO|nr:NDP-sugar pyrophosphorylase, includes eIF-2Bgamma, eIF-2Bepsilon, and LPS biosynthesis proteins [Thiocapsa roseopersicina]
MDMDQAVLFADRLGSELIPLTERTSVALLPVAGKPMIEHALESLAKAGIRRILVVVSPFADEIQRVIGDGTRWGLRLTYTLTRGEEDPTAVIDRLGTRLDGPIVALRGDLIHGFDVPAWISAAETTPGDSVWADADGVSAACGIHRAGALDLTPLSWPPTRREASATQTAWIPVAAEQVRTVQSLAEYHRVNLDAIAKRLPGLILPGRQAALGLTLGRGSRVSPRSLKQGVCLVGARCRIAPDAELTGEVVISDDVIVDRRATINSSVILPHTYVGELVEITNAIVSANTMIRVDSGAVLQVTDACLLADLKQATLSGGIADPVHRLLGTLGLILSLPLWPIAALAALPNRDRGWFDSITLRGNKRDIDAFGQATRRNFVAREWRTRIPILRALPRLLAVASGDLRLVGVTPLSPEAADGLGDDWERIREEAPAGLFGPTQLDVPRDAPFEEKLMSDVFYARQRRIGRDLVYLLRGLLAILRPASWRPPPQRPGLD